MFNRIATIQIPGELFFITDLRINFKVEKSLVGYPNLANIKIYNLSESSRNKIEKEGLKILLYAGYEDTSVPLLFDGDIINVVHLKNGTDWISELFCADGINILSTATINKTLPAGMNTSQIYDELVGQMQGITKGATEGLRNCLSGKRSLLREIQLSGNVKDFLDKLSKDCGFDYSVNDGVIETTPTGLPLSDVPPVIINQGSGMIGSPERTEIGINVTHFLLPELKLARTIRVESITARINVGNLFFRKVPPIRNEGIYRIDELTHIGDTRDNPWETQIQARIF